MTTTRVRLGRAALGAAMIAFTCFGGAAHAEPAPASDATTTPGAATSAATPAPAAAPAPDTSTTTSTTTEPPAEPGKRTAWPWIIMGGGVALIVTATVLQIHAVNEDDRRESDEVKLISLPQGDPARAALQKSAAEHDDSAKSNRTASLVIGTVGFLAVAGSVVLWFVEGGSSASAPAAKPKPSLLPSFGPGYAGASFGASF